MGEILEDGMCLNVLFWIYLKKMEINREPCETYSERTGTPS